MQEEITIDEEIELIELKINYSKKEMKELIIELKKQINMLLVDIEEEYFLDIKCEENNVYNFIINVEIQNKSHRKLDKIRLKIIIGESILFSIDEAGALYNKLRKEVLLEVLINNKRIMEFFEKVINFIDTDLLKDIGREFRKEVNLNKQLSNFKIIKNKNYCEKIIRDTINAISEEVTEEDIEEILSNNKNYLTIEYHTQDKISVNQNNVSTSGFYRTTYYLEKGGRNRKSLKFADLKSNMRNAIKLNGKIIESIVEFEKEFMNKVESSVGEKQLLINSADFHNIFDMRVKLSKF